MGYTSEVYIGVRARKEYLLAEIAALRLSGDELVVDALDFMTCHQDPTDESSALLEFYKDGMKWYGVNPIVRALMSIFYHFRHQADEPGVRDNGLAALFLRVGEEMGDMEEEYAGDDPWSIASIVREISRASIPTGPDLRPRLNSAA